MTPVIPIDSRKILRDIDDIAAIGFWQGLTRDRIRSWLNQFQAGDEKLLAALILRNLIYRSKEHVVASLRQAMERGLGELARLGGVSLPLDWSTLCNGTHTQLNVRFAPVGWRDMAPGKSGQLLSRWVRRHLRVAEGCVINPWDFPAQRSPAHRLVFVDDTLGSGHQFEECIDANGLAQAVSDGVVGYVPAIAHSDGITHLRGLYPNLILTPAECLDASHCFRSLCKVWDADKVRYPFSRSPWNVYIGLVARIGPFEGRQASPLGYEDMDLLLGLEEAAPDNAIPILWDRSSKWKPLLDR